MLAPPKKEIFLGSTAGSPPAGKILTCLLPFLNFLLNLCLPLGTDTTSPRFEGAGSTAWSVTCSGGFMVAGIGSFPFLGGPPRFGGFGCGSGSPGRLWIAVLGASPFSACGPGAGAGFGGGSFVHWVYPLCSFGFRGAGDIRLWGLLAVAWGLCVAGRWALSGLGGVRLLWGPVPNSTSSGVRRAGRVYSMILSNNCASFHLW